MSFGPQYIKHTLFTGQIIASYFFGQGRADGEEISPSSSEPDSDEDEEETDARTAAMQCSQS